jgi:hypothetical protein
MFEGVEMANIPHLVVLNSRLRQALGDEPERQRIQEFSLEQLPYSMSAAAMAFVSLVKSQMDAPNCIPDFPRETNGVGIVFLPEHVRNMMGHSIDNYFDAATRVQNAVNTYISKLLKLSVPSSMSDMIKKIENKKLILPDNINAIITRYWQSDGLKIRHYRDLAQHFAVVSSDARLIRMPTGLNYIYIVLPNNPSEKSPVQLKYENPRIDAFDYIFSSYMKLYEYIYVVTLALLSYTTATDHEEISILFKTPLSLGARPPEGHPIPDLAKMVSLTNKYKEDIAKKYS